MGLGFAQAQAVYQEVVGRLVTALGRHIDGGRIWAVEAVGPAALPDLVVAPRLDVLLELAEFPPGATDLDALISCGFHEEARTDGFVVLVCDNLPVRLLVGDPAREEGMDLRLARDYLLTDPGARRAWGSAAGEPPEGLVAAARRWHITRTGFGPVERLAAELGGLRAPWMIASGWALDLFLGKVTRVHHDLDLLVLRPAQLPAWEYLGERGWRLDVVKDHAYRPWRPGERLELPVTQVHARREGEFLDVLLGDVREGKWFFRRQPEITIDLMKLSLPGRGGIPALRPEVVLLFKSSVAGRGPREKDREDFLRTLPALASESRAWLRQALERHAPTHQWLGLL